MAEFKVEEVTAFIKLAALSSRKKYFSEAAWAKMMKLRENEADHSRMWQARVDLFHDIEKALAKIPRARSHRNFGGALEVSNWTRPAADPEIKAALLRAGPSAHWPALVRWQVEALHMMS